MGVLGKGKSNLRVSKFDKSGKGDKKDKDKDKDKDGKRSRSRRSKGRKKIKKPDTKETYANNVAPLNAGEVKRIDTLIEHTILNDNK